MVTLGAALFVVASTGHGGAFMASDPSAPESTAAQIRSIDWTRGPRLLAGGLIFPLRVIVGSWVLSYDAAGPFSPFGIFFFLAGPIIGSVGALPQIGAGIVDTALPGMLPEQLDTVACERWRIEPVYFYGERMLEQEKRWKFECRLEQREVSQPNNRRAPGNEPAGADRTQHPRGAPEPER